MVESSKKRGRPKKTTKEEKPEINEYRKEIRMKTDVLPIKNSGEDFGEVRNSPVITVEDIHDRWTDIFSRFSGKIGVSNIIETWSNIGKQTYNPFLDNQRIKQENSKATKVNKKTLQEALLNPSDSEATFRNVSMNLYLTNYVYSLLISLNRNTPEFKWYAIPTYLDAKSKKEDVVKEGYFVDKILKKFNPQLTCKTIATQVALEGKSSYFVRESHNQEEVNFFLLQKLDSDMVKLTGFGSKQTFKASFNMMVFLQPSYSVDLYPQYIRDVWAEMNSSGFISKDKKGKYRLNVNNKMDNNYVKENSILEISNNTYMYWVELPQDLCYTFYSDGATPVAAPDTIGMFSDFNDLDNYKWLQASLLSKGVNSVLTAEVPFDKSAKGGTDATIVSPDVVLGFQQLFQGSVSGNILPFFAPFTNFQLHNVENQPEAMDILYNRTRDLIATSGNASLMPITDKPSIASVKAAELLQASKNEYLTRQFESFFNNVVNEYFGLKNTWKVTLWGDIFYIRDDAKELKDLISNGYKGLIPRLLSAYDMSVMDYEGSNKFIEMLGIEIKSEQGEKSLDNEKKPVGRKKLQEDEVENDNTGISQDAGNNVSEIK